MVVNSRNILDLDPKVQDVCLKHVALCKQRGIEIIVTSTWRDYEAQEQLYAIGRTTDKDRKPVTNARAGQSFHNFRVAWDVVPVINGKAVWDSKDPVWEQVIRAGV